MERLPENEPLKADLGYLLGTLWKSEKFFEIASKQKEHHVLKERQLRESNSITFSKKNYLKNPNIEGVSELSMWAREGINGKDLVTHSVEILSSRRTERDATSRILAQRPQEVVSKSLCKNSSIAKLREASKAVKSKGSIDEGMLVIKTKQMFGRDKAPEKEISSKKSGIGEKKRPGYPSISPKLSDYLKKRRLKSIENVPEID